jgi:3-mercaptopyruvate sulfurtransferase SseA
MGSEMVLLSRVGAVMLLVAAMAGSAHGCSCCGGGSDNGVWSSGLAFIGVSAEAVSVTEKNYASETAGEDDSIGLSSEITAEKLAERLKSGQSLVMAYVGVPGDASFIEGDGSIQLPLAQVFNKDGSLKSTSEIAVLFGAAGITEGDTVVIYGDNLVYETFAFWVMKYLGHENVLILDGTREDREAAGFKFVADPTPRAAATYNPNPNLDLLASDADLTGAQLVDASSVAEYGDWHMDGAVNIPASTVMGPDNRFADDETLSQVFSSLGKGQRTFTISDKGGQASLVWYLLYIRGYDVGLYIPGVQV